MLLKRPFQPSDDCFTNPQAFIITFVPKFVENCRPGHDNGWLGRKSAYNWSGQVRQRQLFTRAFRDDNVVHSVIDVRVGEPHRGDAKQCAG